MHVCASHVKQLICSLMKQKTTVCIPATQDEHSEHHCSHSQVFSH